MNYPKDTIEGREFSRSEVNCYLCGKQRPSRRIAVQYGMHAMVSVCNECRLGFQNPRPSLEASMAYMDWRWHSSDSYVDSYEAQIERAKQEVSYVKQFVDGPVKLLDFGAGVGTFARVALDEGWDVTGIERGEFAREKAKEVYDVDLHTEMPDEIFDVATLWDVVEHLRDPREVLSRVGKRIRKNGFIFLQTANFENWIRTFKGDEWGEYLFDHQFYFSPDSLNRILEDAGFSDFMLLDCNRNRPSFRPKKLISLPVQTMRKWYAYLLAKARWPKHGDIDLMIVAARKSDTKT